MAFQVVCSERVNCVSVLRVGGSNWLWAVEYCACSVFNFLVLIVLILTQVTVNVWAIKHVL